MKTKERLLFMALGGLLVLAGMIVDQFVFSTAQAQAGAKDVVFNKVTCRQLSVVNGLGTEVISLNSGWTEKSGGFFTLRSSDGYRRITMHGNGPHSYMALFSGEVRDITNDDILSIPTDVRDHRITFYGWKSGGEIDLGTEKDRAAVEIDADDLGGGGVIRLKQSDGSISTIRK